MGYYTRYSLKTEPEFFEKVHTIEEFLSSKPNISEEDANRIVTTVVLVQDEVVRLLSQKYFPFNPFDEATKWYECLEDMKDVSLQMPGIIFTLKGEGEEAEDIWIAYFKDGKHQICKAEITFPPFDEGALE